MKLSRLFTWWSNVLLLTNQTSKNIERQINSSIKMEMVNKIEEILNTSAGELANMIQNVEKQFEEFANQIESDIKKNDELLQTEIKKIIEANKSKEDKIKACAKDRDKAAANLKEETEKHLKTAEEKFRSKIGEVGQGMEKSFEKLRKFHEDSHRTINKIIEETKANPMDMAIKLKDEVEPLQKKFTAIREDIAKNLKASFEKSQTILKELESTVNSIDAKTRKQYSEITEQFRKCSGKLIDIIKLMVGCLFPANLRGIEWI